MGIVYSRCTGGSEELILTRLGMLGRIETKLFLKREESESVLTHKYERLETECNPEPCSLVKCDELTD